MNKRMTPSSSLPYATRTNAAFLEWKEAVAADETTLDFHAWKDAYYVGEDDDATEYVTLRLQKQDVDALIVFMGSFVGTGRIKYRRDVRKRTSRIFHEGLRALGDPDWNDWWNDTRDVKEIRRVRESMDTKWHLGD